MEKVLYYFKRALEMAGILPGAIYEQSRVLSAILKISLNHALPAIKQFDTAFTPTTRVTKLMMYTCTLLHLYLCFSSCFRCKTLAMFYTKLNNWKRPSDLMQKNNNYFIAKHRRATKWLQKSISTVTKAFFKFCKELTNHLAYLQVNCTNTLIYISFYLKITKIATAYGLVQSFK